MREKATEEVKNSLRWPVVGLNCIVVIVCSLVFYLGFSTSLWLPAGLFLVLLGINLSYRVYLRRLKNG